MTPLNATAARIRQSGSGPPTNMKMDPIHAEANIITATYGRCVSPMTTKAMSTVSMTWIIWDRTLAFRISGGGAKSELMARPSSESRKYEPCEQILEDSQREHAPGDREISHDLGGEDRDRPARDHHR